MKIIYTHVYGWLAYTGQYISQTLSYKTTLRWYKLIIQIDTWFVCVCKYYITIYGETQEHGSENPLRISGICWPIWICPEFRSRPLESSLMGETACTIGEITSWTALTSLNHRANLLQNIMCVCMIVYVHMYIHYTVLVSGFTPSTRGIRDHPQPAFASLQRLSF